MEKITKSTAYSSTINQLPLLNDPRILNDNHLSTLAFYRSTLEAAKQIREILLEDRLTKLNAENFELIEENGIKRGEILFSSEWAAICPSDRWAYFLGINEKNFNESYGTWTITSMTPAHPEKNKYQLICIEINPDRGSEPQQYNKNSTYISGLLTERELRELRGTLQKLK